MLDLNETAVYRSPVTDTAYNLSAEEWILDHCPFPALILYENSESVVMGKNQNPWLECAPAVIEGKHIPILRRISGGGTVVHGPGNLNVGFVVARGGFDRRKQLLLIADALAKVGITAEVTDRGDIYVGERKISGNAMCYRNDRVLHHATVLVNADLQGLLPAIRPADVRLTTHAIASQRAIVANLTEFNPDLTIKSVMDLIVSEFMNVYPDAVDRIFPDPDNEALQAIVLRHNSWDWVFGRTPRFGYCVAEDACVTVVSGRIQSATREDVCARAGYRVGDKFDLRVL